ncbi:polysaccharide biosynthesis tyrosine autokinase [Muricauda sp. 2012CJ35-5]|uniref:non-specific protein-tyrosine kinase n=1 Tax=Flagellimonas spongiicola TaxID=2942208 RepID=A0ABT0PVZ4_9FLAO|nr:polysaccharide biosynthesis tyrosine autokinase [Allomuricauda spongiicola]MCL6275558.1 polysaccharide biosynthesis tyrosine autokinase [Allomuricauda spongiicola]
MGENIDLKELLLSYVKHWKWFALSMFVCLVLGYLYLRYTTPEYIAEAKIQIEEDKDSSSGLDLFSELDVFSGAKNKVEDEIEIINSRSNLIDVVRALGLNTTITALGDIRDTEFYANPPINVNFIAPDSTLNKADFAFYFTYNSETDFGYSEYEEDPPTIVPFGRNIDTPIGDMVVTPNSRVLRKYEEAKLEVSVTPVGLMAQSYNDRLNITVADEFSNIVYISLEDPIKEKATDVIDELIKVYNLNAIADKKNIADKTADFIDARIADISSSLNVVDQSAEEFKTGRGVTDIASEANINLNIGAANRQDLANANTQLQIAASMKEMVDQQESYEVLPSNLGLSDPGIAGNAERYNQLVLERNRLLKSSNEKNPVIVNLDQQLNGLKRTMQSSLNSTVNNLGMQVNTLSNQQAIIRSKIYSAPKNERALRDITRRQETTESLYLYLLQKREEAQIAVASTAQKCKIIDSAYNPTPYPISPNRPVIYLASLIFGFLMPFSVIYVHSLIDNKIHNLHGLEKLVDGVPILGEIPRLSKKEEKIIVKDDRSVLAEALRIVRTNLDYLIKTRQSSGFGKNNVVYITSSVSGEGKTFVSSNMAMILASTNKKVLLIGADIRNPKIYSFFTGGYSDNLASPKRGKDAGLTEYILNKDLTMKDVTNTMLVYENEIDVVYSGRIPPNPAELLLSKRMKTLIQEASEKYDYVLVDTAPLMVVTDTLLISNYADHLIYVTRAETTEVKAVEYPIKLQEEGKIKGLCFAVNDVKASELGYGGKYGYGYGKSTKKWWKL